MKKIVAVLFLFLALSSCMDKSQPEDYVPSIEENEAVLLINASETTYSLELQQMCDADLQYLKIPKYSLVLHPSTSTGTIALGTDVGGTLIGEESATDLDMPAGAAFYVKSEFSGDGNLYYGMVEKDQMVIYKRFKDEQHLDKKDEVTQFKKIKSVKINADAVMG